jgi:hypothetical protein
MKAMKTDLVYYKECSGYQRTFFISIVICTLLFINDTVIAQDVKDSSAKLAFNMNLNSMYSNGNRAVKVRLSRKENRKTIIVDDLRSPLILYLNDVKAFDHASGTGLISKLNINNEGEGVFEFPLNFNQLTSGLHEFTFIVKMDSDPKYEDAEEKITVADAKINIAYSGMDSIKTATATLLIWKDNDYVPMPDVELKLCIKRTFNFLPFGEAGATTDSAGNISGDLPLDIPGNTNKTLTIGARLEEDETYGNLEVTKDVPWAVLPKVNAVRGRTLWSQGDNAPLLLVISSVTIIVIIWGTIFYLVYLLFKIKRLSKTL